MCDFRGGKQALQEVATALEVKLAGQAVVAEEEGTLVRTGSDARWLKVAPHHCTTIYYVTTLLQY